MTSTKPKSLAYWKDHDPKAITLAALPSSVKLSAIRGIGNSQRIDFEKACEHLFGCKPEGLCWQAADTFIAWLKAQPIQAHPSHALNYCPICQHLQTERDGAVVCGNGHSFEIINRPLSDHQSMVM